MILFFFYGKQLGTIDYAVHSVILGLGPLGFHQGGQKTCEPVGQPARVDKSRASLLENPRGWPHFGKVLMGTLVTFKEEENPVQLYDVLLAWKVDST